MLVEFTPSGYRIKHGGSGTAYANYGCRCGECTEANRVRVERRRLTRSLSEFTGTHGKRATYSNWGCRCEPCSEAHSKAVAAEYKTRKARGYYA